MFAENKRTKSKLSVRMETVNSYSYQTIYFVSKDYENERKILNYD